MGNITLTKTLAGDSVTGDTFYFALFTKNAAGDYVRYEDAPVQSLTFTEAGKQNVTFEDVPKGVEFYVLETNANGVLADTDFANTPQTAVSAIPPNRQHRRQYRQTAKLRSPTPRRSTTASPSARC